MKRRLLYIALLLPVVLSMGVNLMSATVSADNIQPVPHGDWISQTQISYNGQTFTELSYNNLRGSNPIPYHSGNDINACDDIIDNFDNGAKERSVGGNDVKLINPTGALYSHRAPDKATGACNTVASTKIKIILDDVPNVRANFQWKSSSTIISAHGISTGQTYNAGGAPIVFALDPADNIFYSNSTDHCKDSITAATDTTITLIIRHRVDLNDPTSLPTEFQDRHLEMQSVLEPKRGSTHVIDACTVFPAVTVPISNFNSAHTKVPDPSDTSSDGVDGGPVAPGINCSVSIFNPLSWFLCPLAVTFQTLAAALDNQIADALRVDTTKIDRFHATWSVIRNLSLGLIVIAALAAVISQALGYEMLDAYALRKALPRVIITAVGISLSWPLIKEFIVFTNDLGDGVRQLIYAAAKQPGDNFVSLGGGGTAVSGLLVGGAIAAMGFAALLSFAVTGALAASVAFLTLIIRQMLLVFLIVFSPIAMVCYVLPNTQKIWKLWWDSFSKALLMFPILMAFIAIGHVFSVLASKDSGSFNQIIAFTAYFAPYFLISLTFKLAGGALGALGGAVHNGHGGIRNGMKSFRGNRMKQRRHNAAERIKGGNALRGEGAASRRISNALETASLIGAGGATLSARKRRARMQVERNTRQHNESSKAIQENEHFKAFNADDDKLIAGVMGEDEAGVRAQLVARDRASVAAGGTARFADMQTQDQAVAEIMAAKRTMGRETFNKAAVRSMSPTGTAFQDGGDMLEYINRAYGSDRSGAGKALAEMKEAAVRSGRVEIGGASYGTLATQLTKMHEGTATRGESTREILKSVRRSSGGATAAYGKPQSAAAIGAEHAQNIGELLGSLSSGKAMDVDGETRVATSRDVKQAMAAAHGVHDALRSASPENAKAFADKLMGVGINVGALSSEARAALGTSNVSGAGGSTSLGPQDSLTIRQAMDNLAGSDQTYLEMRTDFQTAAQQQISNLQNPIQPGVSQQPGAPGGPPGRPGA